MKQSFFSWFFIIAALASTSTLVAQVDRIELGWQTTKRGIVWHRPGLPTHAPVWQFSRDTNAVFWMDTLTGIRYDWDYLGDRWMAKGTFTGPLPPRPEQTSGAALVDNRTGYWLRDTFGLLHKYDSTANAWTPLGDFFVLAAAPTDISAGATNGAAKYTRSLWQNSSTYEVRYWDSDSWEPFVATSGGGIYGDGTPGSGSDTLPSGGSLVTIPNDYSPLGFSVNSDPINPTEIRVIEVTTSHCADDTYVNYLKFKTPADSFKIQSYDCGTIIREEGGELTLWGTDRMIFNADSFYFSTIPQKTTLGGLIGFGQIGNHLSQIRGTATGQVLKWSNAGAGYWYPDTISAGGGGTLTGAENGLNVVANKVRLGGNLLTTTSIEGDGNELRFFDGKLSVSSYSGFADSPVQGVRFSGLEGSPTTSSSPTQDGIVEFKVHNSVGGVQSNELVVGGYATDADGVWMQARSGANPSFEYPLSLQPRGGQFSVGRLSGLDALATIAGSGLAGSTITGQVLHLENSEGNAKSSMSLGVGTDVLDSEVGYFDAPDALRITNRNTVTGTSSVRIAVGGETADKVIVTGSSVTPNARLGIGHTATTTIKSTLDSKGSFAAAVNQTTGNLTLTEAHHIVRYTLNSTPTFTLPSASDCPGREYIIHHFGSGGQINLSQNVISSTGTTFNNIPARNWAHIYSDGSDWYGYRLQSL